MRSSRFAPSPDPLDPGAAGFAHRGLHHAGVRENSLAAVEAALANGAGIEIDVLLSSDSVPVLLHDRDLGRFGPSDYCDPRDVGAMTADDLAQARLADGLPIAPRLSDALALVAGDVPILIEAKADPAVLSQPLQLAAAIHATISDYLGPVGVMSFHPLVPRWLARNAPSIRRGLVVDGAIPAWRRKVAMGLADPQFLAVHIDAIGDAWVERARRRCPVYCWTVRSPADRNRARAYADSLIWEADGRP
jgi:glycerophosphoryl diester phosphodiesterase